MAKLIVEIEISTTKVQLLDAIENNRLHLRLGDYNQNMGNDGFLPWMEDAEHIAIDEADLKPANDNSFYRFKLLGVEDYRAEAAKPAQAGPSISAREIEVEVRPHCPHCETRMRVVEWQCPECGPEP